MSFLPTDCLRSRSRRAVHVFRPPPRLFAQQKSFTTFIDAQLLTLRESRRGQLGGLRLRGEGFWRSSAPEKPRMAPRWPQHGPKMPHNGPRCPQDAPKMEARTPTSPQDGANMSQDGPKEALGWTRVAPRWPKRAPRWPQEGPEGFQDDPKRGHKEDKMVQDRVR